ncbi:ABC transporter permease [Actinoplanes sp. N902-109]|uniref:ABC transporter permease n=1 Tax=Actinoplanes sp. (strain N902-109) TaxID=649831 RepID=UPI00032948F4|nr:ABC transporter permease [Actinoplanes sp. N902-109]AGL20454.1 ABC-2 type transporter [Actinoplanes sp. N902-109]
MSSISTAARTGFARGGIELKQTLTKPADIWQYVFPSVLLLGSIFFMGDATVPGTGISLGSRTLPSALGMGIAFSGVLTVAMLLTVDREDGTLLRAKATPNGMSGYLIGKITLVGGMSAIGAAIQIVPGLFLVDGLHIDAFGWFTLLWLLPLGFVATMPMGAVVGSLMDGPRNLGLLMLPLGGLVAISGIFYPITAMPGWLQAVAQFFPIYWLGLGMRSVCLPDALTAAELGHSWRLWETGGVLGAWAVAGLVVAPVILRRMARRESGSAVAARREKAISRAV